ncbi:hypothetical protein VIGAN_01279500 [Vigna angularis var. angularis]|uniref:Uncharacterized protein n=1 Tax=Vigna angularis var. angularis TaxID=157739 RepID=A0A0S3R2Z8_PHAAN|nr:hypothetical protein VIGAN_01279500 [Vigna angularis var. angularis]
MLIGSKLVHLATEWCIRFPGLRIRFLIVTFPYMMVVRGWRLKMVSRLDPSMTVTKAEDGGEWRMQTGGCRVCLKGVLKNILNYKKQNSKKGVYDAEEEEDDVLLCMKADSTMDMKSAEKISIPLNQLMKCEEGDKMQ